MSSRPELKVNAIHECIRKMRGLTLDQVDDEVGFISFFRNLPVKDDECVRVFKRGTSGGDFYTAHGDDAAFIAMTVNRFPTYTRLLV